MLFSDFSCLIRRIYELPDFFSSFWDLLPAFTCARAIGNL